MNAEQKKKLCWNCEGRVAFSDENCSFCGVYLSPADTDFDEIEEHEQSHQPIYEPQVENQTKLEAQDSSQEPVTQLQDSGLIPFVLLLVGSIFLIFGVILFSFARQGTLTLQWDATYWYVYLLIALAFLAFGWKTLTNLKN